jgi:glutaminyl-tRNA synthetase
MGEHVVPFTNTIFIDRSDFREVGSPDYFRLAPGKSVGLLSVKYPIAVTSFKKDATGKVTELICQYMNDPSVFKKPKTYIHWIAQSTKFSSPVGLDEVRIYEQFFMHANPDDKRAVPDGYLTDINPDSLKIVKGAIAEVGIWDQLVNWIKNTGAKDPESMRWQFVRTGYFCLDKDSVIEGDALAKDGKAGSAVGRLVINRIVTLKEDTGKGSGTSK